MWNFFDKIYLINLKHRKDRLFNSAQQFHKYKIHYEVWEATYNQNGAEGIYTTLMAILKDSILKNYKNILIFEDDVKFLVNPNDYVENCISQLPKDYDMFYMGANIPNPVNAEYYSENLIRVTRALALHAVAISYEGMIKIFSLQKNLPIDLSIANAIQKEGNCYCALPLVASQYEGYSDIEKRGVNYRHYIDERFEKVVQSIKTNQLVNQFQ